MRVELVALVVEDYDSAIEFFVGALGFELIEDSPSLTNDGRPKRWVVVRPPGAQTGMLLAQADGGRQQTVVGDQFAGRVGFFLRTEDFAAQHQRMTAAGVRFVTQPRHEPYGQVAVFLDIAGNKWDLLGPAMVLRAAELADLPALVDVQEAGAVQALSHIFPQDTHPFPRADLLRRWAAEVADPDVDVFVIEQDGHVAGFAAVRAEELLHFGTAVSTWGSGLAAAALDRVREKLAGPRARLRVFEENHRARRFYEKAGWRRTGQVTRTSFPPHPVLVEYDIDLSRRG